jgi:hypothetical protein
VLALLLPNPGTLVLTTQPPGYYRGMVEFLKALKRLAGRNPRGGNRRQGRTRRRDPDFVGVSQRRDIERAPPGRAQELAGHAVERVDT